MKTGLSDLKSGEVLAARWLNVLKRSIDRFAGLRVSAPLMLSWSSGIPTISLVGATGSGGPESVLTARIVARGTGAFYSWHEVKPTSGGNWTDGSASGTTTSNNALEQNGNTGVGTGLRVDLRQVNGQWIFQLGPCNVTKPPQVPPLPLQDFAVFVQQPDTALIMAAITGTLRQSNNDHIFHVPPGDP